MKKDLRIEEVGDELILWDDGPLQAHVLDRVQTRIYRLATEGKSVEEIEGAFRAAFRVPPEVPVRPMVMSCLHQFIRAGLIDDTTPGLESEPYPDE